MPTVLRLAVGAFFVGAAVGCTACAGAEIAAGDVELAGLISSPLLCIGPAARALLDLDWFGDFLAAARDLRLQHQCINAMPRHRKRPTVCMRVGLSLVGKPLASIDRREMLFDHVTIGLEPVTVLDELAALHRPDLYPTTALMILGR